MPNTKIVATLGPATDAPGVLRQLLAAGVDVFRLNASHGAQDEHAARIDAVRGAARDARVHAGILLDLQGPKIRLGRFEDGHAMLETGTAFTITTEPVIGTAERASTGYSRFAKDVQPGARILLADGIDRTRALESDGISVRTRRGERRTDQRSQGHQPAGRAGEHSLADGEGSGRSAFRPGRRASIWWRSPFVRTADDVRQLRDRLGGRPDPDHRQDREAGGLDNIESILDVTDGVMVARGDLGVEMSLERVPRIQKSIIRRARRKGKFVITATQMLESMIEQPHAHARRGERCCQRDLRRHRCGDALGRDLGRASIRWRRCVSWRGSPRRPKIRSARRDFRIRRTSPSREYAEILADAALSCGARFGCGGHRGLHVARVRARAWFRATGRPSESIAITPHDTDGAAAFGQLRSDAAAGAGRFQYRRNADSDGPRADRGRLSAEGPDWWSSWRDSRSDGRARRT